MLVAGIWIAAAISVVLAVVVFHRAQADATSDDERQGIGKWLVPMVMVGMMSLRLSAALHRGAVVTLPVAVAAASIVVLITFGITMRPD